jgi:hypothetical protein
MLHLHPVAEQLKIIRIANPLRAKTTQLAAISWQKLAVLEALKNSLSIKRSVGNFVDFIYLKRLLKWKEICSGIKKPTKIRLGCR